ncbi:hypothetical protein [Nocardioides sp.]|uniref:hypothetical protein n=1 Tax=Nocardioides sp. TaxID=35761 RepID=UPI0031FE9776|nr:hypothetical protein [Nocardioides sp.]
MSPLVVAHVSPQVVVYVLTALAALVVVLTRLRLGKDDGGAGRFQVPRALIHLHLVFGVLALLSWLVFLIAADTTTAGSDTVGIIALACWWIVVLIGLLILVRWLPSHGKHAASSTEDSWSAGPGLSVLAHVGMFVGVCVFTWAYLNAKV